MLFKCSAGCKGLKKFASLQFPTKGLTVLCVELNLVLIFQTLQLQNKFSKVEMFLAAKSKSDQKYVHDWGIQEDG